MLLSKILVIMGFTASLAFAADSTQNPKGWLWYQDPTIPLEKKQEKKPQENSSSTNVVVIKKTATERLEDQKKAFEEAKALAILEPTLENVANMQKQHNFIMSQASDFQKSWSIAELLDPGYEPTPTSPGALKVQEKLDEEALAKDLKELSKSYGLIFAFKSDCPYCHQFAPLVKSFAKKYGFNLEGLSKGDTCFEGMTCSKNEAALLAVNPKLEFPILYLANPKTNEVAPIARGYISLDELMKNVKYALQFLKKEGTL